MRHVEIIAEAGINHDGNFGHALRHVEAAKAVGADVVKFQASFPDKETSRAHAPEHLEMIERFILPHSQLAKVKEYCAEIGIEFLCTPAEEWSLEWMIKVGCTRVKVGSDNLTNVPFLSELSRLPLSEIIFSTGMASRDEILRTLDMIGRQPGRDLTFLHCTSAYPCPIEDANLDAIDNLPRYHRRGWSDHTTSLHLPSCAVMRGAEVIEKHLTVLPDGDGPDHAASLDPLRFAQMVKMIRETEKALGTSVKLGPMPSERDNYALVRKSIFAREAIKKGEIFTRQNLATMRPGTGVPASKWWSIVGAIAARDYEAGEML